MFRSGAIYYLFNFLIFLFDFDFVEGISEEQNLNRSVDSFKFLLCCCQLAENLPVLIRRGLGIIFVYTSSDYSG